MPSTTGKAAATTARRGCDSILRGGGSPSGAVTRCMDGLRLTLDDMALCGAGVSEQPAPGCIR